MRAHIAFSLPVPTSRAFGGLGVRQDLDKFQSGQRQNTL